MISPIPVNDLLNACVTLFGSQVNISAEFLNYLQPSGAKSAFRKKVKETHPDILCPVESHQVQCCTEKFRKTAESYQLIKRFFQQREAGVWKSHENLAPQHFKQKSGKVNSPGSRAREGNSSPVYHQGPVPQHHLAFGKYLYYLGLIPYHEVLEALTWQRSQRPAMGVLARNWGWLDDASVQLILRTTDFRGLFGKKAMNLSLLTPYQVRMLLSGQQSRQGKIGQYFIQAGYFRQKDLFYLLAEQKIHNANYQSMINRHQNIS